MAEKSHVQGIFHHCRILFTNWLGLTMAEKSHVHTDDKGILHVCYHHCRILFTNWQFWLGLTMGFPFEHLLWEKVWPFYIISHWLGL